jgi:hypothetical protein
MMVLAMLNLLFLLVGFLPGLRKASNRRVDGSSANQSGTE